MTSSGIVLRITYVWQILVQNILLFAKFKTKPIVRPKLFLIQHFQPQVICKTNRTEKKKQKKVHILPMLTDHFDEDQYCSSIPDITAFITD